jgi:putative aldouronate transport system substrate-binding protein
MFRRKHWSVILIGMLAFVIVMSACSSGNSSSNAPAESKDTAAKQDFPLKESVTLNGFAVKSNQDTKNNFNELEVFKKLEQATNVKINWNLTAIDASNEKKNLIFASNDLPDFFLGSNLLNDKDIMKYGPQGQLIPLEGLIDKYAPNTKKIFAARPDIKAGVTAPDGHIYSLPMVFEELNNTSPDALYINKVWLDKLHLPIPQTTDQFLNTLKAFKDNDVNGNGKKDEIPFSFIYGAAIQGLNSLAGSFGYADTPEHLAIDNGKVVYVPIQKGYKDFANYMNQLNKLGLVDPESFTQSVNIYQTKIKSTEPIMGAYFLWDQSYLFGKIDTGYVPVPALKGPDGHQQWQKSNTKFVVGGFAISSANKNAGITLQWFDQIYNPDTSVEHFWGPIGRNVQKNADGTYQFLPTPAGVAPGTYRQQEAPGNVATVMLNRELLDKVKQEDDILWKEKRDLLNLYAKNQPKEVYPNVLMTQEDTERLVVLTTDINTYVKDTLAKWIINGGADNEWDAYLAQLKKMGIDEMIKIYQKYYDASKKK